MTHNTSYARGILYEHYCYTLITQSVSSHIDLDISVHHGIQRQMHHRMHYQKPHEAQ